MPQPRLLVIGGTGFVSGTLAREALDAGWAVWAITRGQRAAVPGVTPLVADRKDSAALAAAIASAGVTFDLAVDCIAYAPSDAEADMAILPRFARQFVLISTDFVYDPAKRRFPQPDTTAHYIQTDSYGGNKRRCELALVNSKTAMPWTVFRPCHIYGPGSVLGCSPPENRDAKLIDKIRGGETLPMVGANFLQQPIFAADLARLILSTKDNLGVHGQIFNSAGPDVIESVRYYQLIAEALGVTLKTKELSISDYLAANPDKAPFLCHRVYDLTRLKAAGLRTPNTPVEQGIREHVKALLV
jgi:nucleoside-diphosphate-sugar epimerase